MSSFAPGLFVGGEGADWLADNVDLERWFKRPKGHERRIGFDHGVGHPLLLLYDAKTPRGQKVKEFNGLGDNPFNASVSLF